MKRALAYGETPPRQDEGAWISVMIDDAIAAVHEVVLFASPLLGEWEALFALHWYLAELQWSVQPGTGVSLQELALDYELAAGRQLHNVNKPGAKDGGQLFHASTWMRKAQVFGAMLSRVATLLQVQPFPGERNTHNQLRLFKGLRLQSCSGISGARPVRLARDRVEQELFHLSPNIRVVANQGSETQVRTLGSLPAACRPPAGSPARAQGWFQCAIGFGLSPPPK